MSAAGPRAFVIGHPIAHSRSPLIHGHWLARHGLTGSYERVLVAPGDLEGFVRGLPGSGFAGGNVTLPHKEAVARFVDDLSETARRTGAVNTLWLGSDGRILGDCTDGRGFLASLDQEAGPGWEGGTALVIGAGGAARAIVAALLDRGVDRIVIANRTVERAEMLRRFASDRVSVSERLALPPDPARISLLVNTTTLGMAGQGALDLDLASLPDDALVADIVYVPAVTPLIRDARARGLRTVGGLGMLLHQAAPGFERWFGVRPAVTGELRRLVEADIEAGSRVASGTGPRP